LTTEFVDSDKYVPQQYTVISAPAIPDPDDEEENAIIIGMSLILSILASIIIMWFAYKSKYNNLIT